MKKIKEILLFVSVLGLVACWVWGFNNLNKAYPIEETIDIIDVDTIIPVEEKIIYDTIIIDATMYYAVFEQCDNTPDITADQTKIPNVDSCSHLNWIAVSQDLLWFNEGPIRYGDTVYIIAGHKTGYYIVRDAMNKRWVNKIDFLESRGTDFYSYNKVELLINS